MLESLLYQHEGAFNYRRKWWGPYTWEHHGIGWNKVVENYDIAEKVGVKGRKLERFRVYGVDVRQYVPFRAVAEFDRFKLVFDRALHETGLLKTYDIKTCKYTGSIKDHSHTVVFKEKKGFNANPVDTEFPGAESLEEVSNVFSGLTVDKFYVEGNHTAAVGLLAGHFIFHFMENIILRLYTIELDSKCIKGVFGKTNGFKQLYVLGVKGGKLK